MPNTTIKEADAQSYYEDEYTGTETVGSNDVVESLSSVLLGGSTYAGVAIGELPENVPQPLLNLALPV